MKRALAITLLLGALGSVAWWRAQDETVAAPAAIVSPPATDAPRSQVSAPAPMIQDQPPAATPDPAQLAMGIDRALVAGDAAMRETAFNQLLPALLASEPARLVGIHARQAPGETRDALRDEIARQWIVFDREWAIRWLHSLEQGERRAGSTAAFRRLAARSTEEAIALADEFGIGRDDGSIRHLEQIRAEEQRQRFLTSTSDTPSGASGISAN